jgi:non-specific serine/threonine protein kinase/serine/threonine-protein kinase
MALRERWAEVRRLFDEALDRDPAGQDALLATVADEDVREEVRSLLAHHATASDFLERPAAAAWEAPARPDLQGQTLGPWRITGELGRGGMGLVYRAVRADAAFEREVALKVIGTTPSPALTERFRLERETLARLDHPAIARLLDGGTTPDGHPYYVMELVRGEPVDRYCDARCLDVDARIALFLDICAGVQSAHENLVVHRDIKPANILVQADGQPKLLDFGVAKLLSAPTDDDPEVPSTWALTPEYASPEQRARGMVTTASDVYSLGVLLHVLLTGLTPAIGPAVVPEHMPSGTRTLPPSRRVVSGDAAARAACRQTTPARLGRALVGDLDAILERALAPAPADRYPTVAQLMQDLERHRRREPVAARPRTLRYVAARFATRHTVGVVITCAALVASAAAVAVIVRQSAVAAEARARAERRFDDLRALTRTFMFDVDEAIVNVPGTTAARALMVKTGLTYLERLAGDAAPDPSLQRELAAGFVKVGDAQGHPTSPNLGDTAGARASYLRAIGIGTGLTSANPDDLDAARTLALARRRLADVLAWMGEPGDALTHAEQSAREFVAVAARAGATDEDRLQRAVALIKLGDLLGNPNLPNLGRRDEALARFVEARGALAPLASAHPLDPRVQRYVGIAFERLGTMHQQAARWTEAADAYRESFVIREALATRAPLHVDVQRDLAIAYEKLANVERSRGHHAAAVQAYRGALDRFVRLARIDPGNANAARSVAIAQEHLADALVDAGQRADAIAPLREALVAHRGLAGRDAQNAQATCDALRVSGRLGDVLGQGQPTRAACAVWTERTRWASTPGAAGCAPEDEARFAARLAGCRGEAVSP